MIITPDQGLMDVKRLCYWIEASLLSVEILLVAQLSGHNKHRLMLLQ
jgi:hypothetical protein